MDYLAQIISEKYSNPIEFLNQLRLTTEPIGGGMECCDNGEYVAYDVAVEAIKKAQSRLIPEDIDTIFKLVLKERTKWADQKACYPEVIKQFYKNKGL